MLSTDQLAVADQWGVVHCSSRLLELLKVTLSKHDMEGSIDTEDKTRNCMPVFKGKHFSAATAGVVLIKC